MSKIETADWKQFKVIDLFEVKNTHSILKNEIEEDSGETPYVTASNENNGVYTYITYNEELKEAGNCIMIGGKTLTITYQKEDFYSNDSHNLALYLNDTDYRTEKVQLFLITALKASIGHTYNWGDSISSKSIQKDIIMLPADKDGNPNFSYMEEYMKNREIAVSASLTKLQSAKQPAVFQKINTKEWRTFHLYDIFEIDSGTKLDKAKMDTTSPKINFVGRSNFNNGITQKVNEIQGLNPYDSGCLTLALGGYLGSCFIQEEPFYTSQNVVVLIPKENIAFEAKQFIATAIFKESQNNYRAFIKELNAHIKRDFVIKLPANTDGSPDYDYMTAYIRKIKKQSSHTLEALQAI